LEGKGENIKEIFVKGAAYQARLFAADSMNVLDVIRQRVQQCEPEGISVLCCPEAILGGLADYAEDPARYAIASDRLEAVLRPLASETVTTIVGFTELAEGGRLYNSAAVFHRGTVLGVYRKLYPAINRSVYEAGRDTPVFCVGGLTFGIVICNDSNYPEPSSRVAAHGATVLFVPTNNALPVARASNWPVTQSRSVDIVRATENHLWVIRADVAGEVGGLRSHRSSAIVNPRRVVVCASEELREDLLVAEVTEMANARC
jgi:predicted amidohydrolase